MWAAQGGRTRLPSILLSFLSILTFSTLPIVNAIYEDQAGKYDWHRQNIGRVQFAATSGSRAFVSTSKNIIAGLDTKRGTVGWRQILEEDETILSLFHHHKNVVTLSAPDIVRVWNARDGSLVWASGTYSQLKSSGYLSARLRTLSANSSVNDFSAHAAVVSTDGSSKPAGSRIAVVTADATVTLYEFSEHRQVWSISLPGAPKKLDACLISSSSSSLQVLAVTSEKLIAWTVDIADGAATKKDLGEPITLSHSNAAAISGGLASVDKASSELFLLVGGSVSKVDLWQKLGAITTLQASPSSNVILATSSKGKTGVIVYNDLGKNVKVSLKYVWEMQGASSVAYGFVKGSGSKASSPALHTRVVRASISARKLTVTLHDISDEDGIESSRLPPVVEYIANAIEVPSHFGELTDVWAQYLKKSAKHRALVLSDSDALVGVQKQSSSSSSSSSSSPSLLWTREESLASVSSAKILPLPLASAAATDGHFPGFFERLVLQFAGVSSFMQRILSGDAAIFGSSSSESNSGINKMESDHFGLQKLVVALTRVGKVFAMSTTQGTEMWVKQLSEEGVNNIEWKDLKQISSNLLVAYGDNESTREGHQDAVAEFIALRPRSGEVLQRAQMKGGERMVITLPLYTSGPWKILNGGVKTNVGALPSRMLLATSFKERETRLIPPTKEAVKLFEAHRSSIFLHSVDIEQDVLRGFAVAKNNNNKKKMQQRVYGLEEIWTVTFPREVEKISDVAAPDNDSPVHSAVSGMGDGRAPRRKYLNPNLIAVATVRTGSPSGAKWMKSPSSSSSSSGSSYSRDSASSVVLYLIDAVSGKIIHRISQKNAQGPVHLVVSENMVVAHYFNTKANSFEVTCVELYEDALKVAKIDATMMAANHGEEGGGNDRASIDLPEFSSLTAPLPTVLQRTFLFAHSVNFLGVAGTRMGITSKLVLAGLTSHQLAGLGKHMLDARRPTGEGPLTKEQQAEGLLPYHPVLKLDGKSFPSYNLTLCRVRGLTTAHSFLESTSLVFAYGVDIFFTRVTASGTFDLLSSDFNRIFLTGTVTLVVVILAVTHRWSRQKKLDILWS